MTSKKNMDEKGEKAFVTWPWRIIWKWINSLIWKRGDSDGHGPTFRKMIISIKILKIKVWIGRNFKVMLYIKPIGCPRWSMYMQMFWSFGGSQSWQKYSWREFDWLKVWVWRIDYLNWDITKRNTQKKVLAIPWVILWHTTIYPLYLFTYINIRLTDTAFHIHIIIEQNNIFEYLMSFMIPHMHLSLSAKYKV